MTSKFKRTWRRFILRQSIKIVEEEDDAWLYGNLLEYLTEDCPNYDDCCENFIQNYEPTGWED